MMMKYQKTKKNSFKKNYKILIMLKDYNLYKNLLLTLIKKLIWYHNNKYKKKNLYNNNKINKTLLINYKILINWNNKN